MLGYLFLSLRPKHWVKNLFMFAALIFSRNLFRIEMLLEVVVGVAVFCAVSSSIYLINDIVDLEEDKHHPDKCARPLPSGKLTKEAALATSVMLVLAGMPVAFRMNATFGFIVLLYFIMNLLYSVYLKRIVIIDVMIIAGGFVLRVLGGAAIIDVETSSWFILCTLFISLFLGFGKRRQELLLLEERANDHREVLAHYSTYFLDQMILIVTSSTLLCYTLYTSSPETVRKFGTTDLIYTTPFVVYGIFRYLYLVHQKKGGSSPTNIMLTDIPLIVTVLLWIMVCIFILYRT